ncbi:MAG: hypothetical protein CW691_01165 [Candidatus Bathyarchaeum sp.]|nr:MAG: hypothetical protein CW691_01165 [Candidatus Bathyarchaeum sp.]
MLWVTLGERQLNETIENFVAMPLIILIGAYIAASAIDPLLNINNQTFKIAFTLVGGIPSILFFFKKRYINNKSTKLKETTQKNHI